MRKWTAGLTGLVLVAFAACSVWAEEAEDGGKRDRKEKHHGEREKDGDGKKDRKSRHRDNPGEMLEKMDKNGDGKVTLEEFTEAHLERLKQMFDRMDANGDGVISKEDREAREKDRKKERDTERGSGDEG